MPLERVNNGFKDLSMSFQANPLSKDLIALKNTNAIARSIKNIVFTLPGEKWFNQNFGSRITASLFENINDITANIIVDAKCGISGAGRSPKLATHFPECNENVGAYNGGHHRHTPEFNQVLQKVSGESVDVLFIPHLVPMDRGILTTTYATACDPMSQEQVLEVLRDYYRDRPFVRVVDNLPTTKQTFASNYCDLTARVIGDRVVLIGSIDNLWKGASAAAVQNFNVMYGFEETTGLCD